MGAVPADSLTRYDYVLGGMGASIACGGVLGVTSAVPLSLAGGAASVVATALLLVGTAGEY